MRDDKDFVRGAVKQGVDILEIMIESGVISATAKMLSHARDALIEHGFTREEAISIIMQKEDFFPKVQ